ncbi:hypothetical protein [Polaromonas sp.]|uniref:hypothetical protein n=1 Tax=Polaromonas sp. TaxID=1869339 RepID=UPI002FC5A209
MSPKQAAMGTAENVDTGEDIGASAAGFGVSYAVTSILSALLVVLKESSGVVHDGLAAITGHHWVTHGLLNLIVFLMLGLALNRIIGGLRMTADVLVTIIVGGTILSGLIIVGYFI